MRRLSQSPESREGFRISTGFLPCQGVSRGSRRSQPARPSCQGLLKAAHLTMSKRTSRVLIPYANCNASYWEVDLIAAVHNHATLLVMTTHNALNIEFKPEHRLAIC